jgi:hypothetical protein
MSDIVSIPHEPLGEWMFEMAKEVSPEPLHEPEANGKSIDYDLNDIEEITVERVDDGEEEVIIAHSNLIGQTQRQTRSATYNPPGKAHPAEYEIVEWMLAAVVEWRPEKVATTNEFQLIIENHGRA